MQETYLKIRASAHLYEPRGKPMAWVFTVARNIAYMHIRRNQSNRVVANPEKDLNGVLAEKLNISERIALQTVLKELDEEERSIILLHAVSGYKHHEIASYLGIPLATALSKYHRGLKKMRRLVAAQEGNGHG